MLTRREQQLLRLIEENPMISQQELADHCGITRSSVAVHISNLMRKGAIQGRGYIMQREPYTVVIGGQNMDISGKPDAPLVDKDSNPGRVRISPGGVGRNIAHNLALLGESVKFITAIGADAYAGQLAEGCRRLGIDISYSLTVPGTTTSTYLFISDHKGDMELAVSDMGIYENITPQFLESRMELINHAALCVVDTNIPSDSIRYLLGACRCPVFADTVSTAKAKKLIGLLPKIHTLKPNGLETELLTGIKITNRESLSRAVQKLLDLGVKQVFVSLGADGVFCADKNTQLHLGTYNTPLVNATGSGDSFMAALAWAWNRGLSLEECARAGLAASSICLSSKETVSSQLSPENIQSVIEGS